MEFNSTSPTFRLWPDPLLPAETTGCGGPHSASGDKLSKKVLNRVFSNIFVAFCFDKRLRIFHFIRLVPLLAF